MTCSERMGLPMTRARLRRAGAAVVSAALLAACSAAPIRSGAPPPLIQHHAPQPAQDVDLLRVSPAMRSFLERYVLPYENERTRVSLLMVALTDKGVLGFHYNPVRTYTAAEAFERRSGNCVAFANLFVALAREAGLDARYQEVFLEPQWSNREETLVVTKHINVVVEAGGQAFMVDVSGQDVSFDSPRRPLRDAEAKAMYFNNLGADALLGNDLPGAYAHFLRAASIAPVPDTWSNLGVLLARNGQPAEAEQAYLQALLINPNELAAMGNLHDLYLMQGRAGEAAQLQRRVERYRRENPYYLLQLAEESMADGQPAEARRLLSRAIGMKGDEHLLHFAKARADYLAGALAEAEESLARARQLAPPEALADYQRPLAEMVWREQAEAPGVLSR